VDITALGVIEACRLSRLKVASGTWL